MRIGLSIFILCLSLPATAQFWLDLESGLVFPGYNDVRIPGEGGTLFSLENDLTRRQDPVIPLRVRPGFTFGERNHVFGLFAPLSLDFAGTAPYDINFEGTVFAGGEPLEAEYKFNSYRLGYRRDVVATERWTVGIGFTGKIRDATVRVSSGEGLYARKDDLGFVPLLHLYVDHHGENWRVFLEGDGLAGGPGRAFDFLIGGMVDINDNIALKGGYRILEGGANTDEVYNFALFNFAAVGVVVRFGARDRQE
jgi:hypothetical protein